MLPPPMTTTRRAPTPSYGWERTLPRPPPSSPLPVTMVAFLIRDWLTCNPAALGPAWAQRDSKSWSKKDFSESMSELRNW
ncbi:Os01g0550701 [Oryza sativa Japonica Group]|uniref:Os01g0550701 protein n=1 Tax=Oryza sativa subsp. japonica TaxID=39947 RepID=A0A0P0V443_ORYSJ|nr:Os01g0550701 [Oryza sativa Japonica Group]